MQDYMSETKRIDIGYLKGLIISEFKINEGKTEIHIKTKCGNRIEMSHIQDCCEDVFIDEIIGDIKDILNYPVLMAEVVTSDKNPENYKASEYQESFTWTFYKLMTIKGNITIRWYGESNGYYSEEVECFLLEEK